MSDNTTPLLSICIPTNGIIELIFPVLDSIYAQNDVEQNLFEVVVMDNGENSEFKTKIKDFANKHSNLVYKETDYKGFLNESESYKVAQGIFIKFINHRTKLFPGAIQYFIDFIRNNETEKPCVYFSNGVIKQIKGVAEYSDFDSYVKNLRVWSSWSTGMGFWKEDFDRIPKDAEFNELYPHTTILFNEKKKSKYIIDNTVLLDEIPVSHANKGRYNLFYAFGIEYPGILSDLLRSNSISKKTFLSVKKENQKFLIGLYLDFVILKHPCSYDLSERKESLNVFYNYNKIKAFAIIHLCGRVLKFPFRCVKRIIRRG
ncbi:glycosyltransferase family A protein [Treponema bryantii]|uniref:glycosyltransferase family A protein n=1 Tax=Treponema bryantii TaxID=163 RepID=UPI0003B2EF48|nr:glycosyltransferase family A protein [Treponema bryantii]